jgi:hypothetical protein
MKKYSFLILFIFLFSNTYIAFAQEDENLKEELHENSKFEKHHKEEEETRHSLALVIGHTHISTAVEDGKDNEWLTIPSFGLFYSYKLNEKWEIGLHTDLLLEEFEVASSSSLSEGGELEIETIERSRPVAVAVMALYEVHHHLILLVGAGAEFAAEESFALIRVGADVPIIEKYGWAAFATVNFDFNIDAYNSFNLGFGIAKMF